MQVVLQRVARASVTVDAHRVVSIGTGYLLLHCVEKGDGEEQATWLAEKVAKLRVFDDEAGKPHMRSVLDIDGEVIVVSQFTLAGSVENGTRPDYGHAASREEAEPLYERFVTFLHEAGIRTVGKGVFGAEMRVDLANDGPLTLILKR